MQPPCGKKMEIQGAHSAAEADKVLQVRGSSYPLRTLGLLVVMGLIYTSFRANGSVSLLRLAKP